MADTDVLIAGAGPIGLALAIDLGRRGIPCTVVERSDGVIYHPRATAQNARTMEFFRRWGIADDVKRAGAPPDFPHTVLYITDLNGFEIARFERASHGGTRPAEISPERPQRVNQLFLDPILHELASSYDSVTLRYTCEFESFVESGDGIVATVRSRGTAETIRAKYAIDATGTRGTLRRALGIEMDGRPTLDYNLSIFFKIPELWSYHDKGKAALHFFVDANGITRNLVQLDGRELWRLGVCDQALYENPERADVAALITQAMGREIPFELIGVARWIAHDLVAKSYGTQRVFMAGDAAHLNPPAGGFGLNTGMGDVVDLGWKIAAREAGWGGPNLLGAYEIERRPIALRNVRQSTENHLRGMELKIDPAIGEDSAAGARARQDLGDHLRAMQGRTFITDGTALGYIYAGSPLVCDDGTPLPEDTIMEYHRHDASRRARTARLARTRPLDHRLLRRRLRTAAFRCGCRSARRLREGFRRARRTARDRVGRRPGNRAAVRTQARARSARRTCRVAWRCNCPRIRARSPTPCAEPRDATRRAARSRCRHAVRAAPLRRERSDDGDPRRRGTDRRSRTTVLRKRTRLFQTGRAQRRRHDLRTRRGGRSNGRGERARRLSGGSDPSRAPGERRCAARLLRRRRALYDEPADHRARRRQRQSDPYRAGLRRKDDRRDRPGLDQLGRRARMVAAERRRRRACKTGRVAVCKYGRGVGTRRDGGRLSRRAVPFGG